MTSKYGALASVLSEINTTVVVYTVPTGKYAAVTIAAVNTGQAAATVSIAVTAGPPPTGSEWLEHDLPLDPGEGVERSAVIMGEGNVVYVRSNAATVAVNVFGIEADGEASNA